MKVETFVVGFLGTNCYIAHDGKCAVVIDPGADADRILEFLESEGLLLSHILLTHAHFDHVLAVDEIKKETGAVLVSTVGERERLRSAEISGHTMLKRREFIPLAADIEVSDGEELTVGEMAFKFIATPGHTEGSVCIICEDTMFSGDTLFAGTCGRCDLIGGSIDEMMKSLKLLSELLCDYKVLPGHGEATTLSGEKLTNPYMAEAVKR